MPTTMTIYDVYYSYHIPENLQSHMIDVAAVGEYVATRWQGPEIDRATIVKTLLLHDLGNIVKFKQPFMGNMAERADYWQQIQAQVRQTYGTSAHQATMTMVRELADAHPELDLTAVIALLNEAGYHQIEEAGYPNWESRICDFADMCVSPQGVVGFEERMQDLIIRYELRGDESGIAMRRENAKLIHEQADFSEVDLRSAQLSSHFIELG